MSVLVYIGLVCVCFDERWSSVCLSWCMLDRCVSILIHVGLVCVFGVYWIIVCLF